MLNKFAEIRIEETSRGKEESIIYYVLEDEQYGIQISKDSEDCNPDDKELVMHNIVKRREDAEYILNNIIKNNIDLTQAAYIIKDFLENQEEKQEDKKSIS